MYFNNYEHFCNELQISGTHARDRFEMVCESERSNNKKSYDEQHSEAIEIHSDFIADQIVDTKNISI